MQNLNQNLEGRTNEDTTTQDRSALSRFVPSREEEERPREDEELQSTSPRHPDGLSTSDAIQPTPSLRFSHAQAMLSFSMAYQKIESMEEQLPACQNELKEARAELAIANERFAAYVSGSSIEASQLHSQLHTATVQNAHLTNLKEAREKENQRLREMLHKARNSLAEFKAQHSDLAEAFCALKKSHDENVPYLHELKREVEATPVELYLSPVETMARSAKCRETNSELERALEEAQRVPDMFRNKLQNQASILAENQGTIRDLQDEIRHLKQELDSKPVLEQVAAVEIKMVKVAERLIEREEETIDTLANLSSVQARLEATNNQVIAYREALDNSKKARDKFNAELDARCLEVIDLTSQLKRSEEAKEDAMAIISHLEANYASRMESITERERTLKQTIDDTRQKNTELEERLQVQSVALFKAKEEISLAKERLLSESAKVDMLKEELTSSLAAREMMVKALKDRYTTLEREFERVKSSLSDSERRNVDLESRVERSLEEVRELQITQQNSASTQSREMDQRLLEAQRQIGLLVKERDEPCHRSENILQRYQTNSLSHEEKVFVEHVMQDARAIHEQDMIKKGQEIRLKEVLIQEIKAKNKELETTVARYIKELSKSSGGDERSVVGLKPFLLGLSSPGDEVDVNMPAPKQKPLEVEGNSRSSSLSNTSSASTHVRASGRKRVRSPTSFSEPPSKPRKHPQPFPAGEETFVNREDKASAAVKKHVQPTQSSEHNDIPTSKRHTIKRTPIPEVVITVKLPKVSSNSTGNINRLPPPRLRAKEVSPTPAGNTASKNIKMSASGAGNTASSSRLPHSASPPDLAAIAAVAPKKKPAGRKHNLAFARLGWYAFEGQCPDANPAAQSRGSYSSLPYILHRPLHRLWHQYLRGREVEGMAAPRRLLPTWRTRSGARDIGWAEPVGFYLLISHISSCLSLPVVGGWKNGCSRNTATNAIFRLALNLVEDRGFDGYAHRSYVPSARNPANDPSWGVYPPSHLILPPLAIPDCAQAFILDAGECRGAELDAAAFGLNGAEPEQLGENEQSTPLTEPSWPSGEDELDDHWQPSLEELVSSIGKKLSAAFDRIGCAGEIRISENEDYEEWAIDVLVKFPDSKKLPIPEYHVYTEVESDNTAAFDSALDLLSLSIYNRTRVEVEQPRPSTHLASTSSTTTPSLRDSKTLVQEDLTTTVATLNLATDRSAAGILTSDVKGCDIKTEQFTLSFHGRLLIEGAGTSLKHGQMFARRKCGHFDIYIICGEADPSDVTANAVEFILPSAKPKVARIDKTMGEPDRSLSPMLHKTEFLLGLGDGSDAIWMKNIEKVVEGAKQNFAASTSPVDLLLPPLSVPLSRNQSQTRPSRPPRRVLAAIFPMRREWQPYQTANNSTTSDAVGDDSANQSQLVIPEIHTPSRQHRATVSTSSPGPNDYPSKKTEKSTRRSHGNLFRRHIAPSVVLEAKLAKPPSPVTTPRLSQVIAPQLISRDNLLEADSFERAYNTSFDELTSDIIRHHFKLNLTLREHAQATIMPLPAPEWGHHTHRMSSKTGKTSVNAHPPSDNSPVPSDPCDAHQGGVEFLVNNQPSDVIEPSNEAAPQVRRVGKRADIAPRVEKRKLVEKRARSDTSQLSVFVDDEAINGDAVASDALPDTAEDLDNYDLNHGFIYDSPIVDHNNVNEGATALNLSCLSAVNGTESTAVIDSPMDDVSKKKQGRPALVLLMNLELVLCQKLQTNGVYWEDEEQTDLSTELRMPCGKSSDQPSYSEGLSLFASGADDDTPDVTLWGLSLSARINTSSTQIIRAGEELTANAYESSIMLVGKAPKKNTFIVCVLRSSVAA
ncbi:hypothetical protein CVT24_004948 [Panaeolus cyanescens]|uniref:Uncharacterized protein n=1 Tax=Panaeolus cyanescens TaxID=181874 RepID=A0A409YB58_9AGAR|nr:hypothetical protein CVT24_004948 [Panaeolus cyanescens]